MIWHFDIIMQAGSRHTMSLIEIHQTSEAPKNSELQKHITKLRKLHAVWTVFIFRVSHVKQKQPRFTQLKPQKISKLSTSSPLNSQQNKFHQIFAPTSCTTTMSAVNIKTISDVESMSLRFHLKSSRSSSVSSLYRCLIESKNEFCLVDDSLLLTDGGWASTRYQRQSCSFFCVFHVHVHSVCYMCRQASARNRQHFDWQLNGKRAWALHGGRRTQSANGEKEKKLKPEEINIF